MHALHHDTPSAIAGHAPCVYQGVRSARTPTRCWHPVSNELPLQPRICVAVSRTPKRVGLAAWRLNGMACDALHALHARTHAQVYQLFAYYFNLDHISNGSALWLGMRPAE